MNNEEITNTFMEKGIINKVAGPLVIAQGLDNAKMFDLVKVGPEKLLGEIIEIKGANTSIQVYEDTTGLGPGDEVIATGEPLSVELGPGLIGSIFDGTQRPLDIIKEKSGNFIQKGVDVNPLDRDKEWPFKALAKKGAQVQAGDVIGEVAEGTIKHFIMVPPGKEGTLEEIKSGGFKVDDTIAIIKTGDGSRLNLSMLSRWPVRKPRPYASKLRPEEPLITGQRVIDTFFPLTKGGTATVPGPFGAGKCMKGDTPVYLVDGRILPISEIFELFQNKGKKTVNCNESYTILDKPLKIYSYKDGKIVKSNAKAVYKGYTNSLVRIKTLSGRKVEVTSTHKLLKYTGEFSFKEERASDLRVADYLAMPKLINQGKKSIKLPQPSNLENLRVTDPTIKKKIGTLVDNLSENITKKELAYKLDISYEVFIEYYNGRNNPTLSFCNKIFNLAHRNLPKTITLKAERQSKPFTLPQIVDNNLAAFLGLILADGGIKKNSLFFYNNDEKLLQLFEKLVDKLFKLDSKRTVANTVDCSYVHHKALTQWLIELGFPSVKKSRNCYIPEFIISGSPEIAGSFLTHYFLCDGHISTTRKYIEIATASKKMQMGLSFLLARIGIASNLKIKNINKFTSFRVFIYGIDQLAVFLNHCPKIKQSKIIKLKQVANLKTPTGFNKNNLVPIASNLVNSIYSNFNRPYSLLKKHGIEIHNYLAGGLISKKILKKIGQVLNYKPILNFTGNHLEHLFLDKIVSINTINNRTEVYDLEVPDNRNFIAGNGPMIVHNTVIQHQIAKWADSEIVVFIGVGERGNEMTDVLLEFAKLIDPYSGQKLMNRTVFIANTSNMPVAAREACIYTGMAIAEYFRDMGYNVSLQADSTSRWAEALREISGRLEEMPGEEGYPAYLASRLAHFYERAGRVKCLGSESRNGSVSVIGSVSPPGGDLSEPVVQNTLRVVKVFWSLEDTLAFKRHFPAINWLSSYSLYVGALKNFWRDKVAPEFNELRENALLVLQKEADLLEIVRLVGMEALTADEKLVIEVAKLLREDFLQQNAFVKEDSYTSLEKQYRILKIIMEYHEKAKVLIKEGVSFENLTELETLKDLARAKFVPEEKLEEITGLEKKLDKEMDRLVAKTTEIATPLQGSQ